MQNKTFLKRLSRSVCMQRYNGVIECKRAKNSIWKLATNGFFALMVRISEAEFNCMGTSKCFHFTVDRSLVVVYSTGMFSKLFVLPYQESKVSENTQFEENDPYTPLSFLESSCSL